MTNQSIADAISKARAALLEPSTPADIRAGWDKEHCNNWLKAVDDIASYVNGDTSQRHFSIVRSLDYHGSETMDHPRGKALMNLAAALRQGGIGHYA